MKGFFTALLVVLLFSFLASQLIGWQRLMSETPGPPSPLLSQLSQEALKFYPAVSHESNRTIIRDSFPSPALAARYEEQKAFLQTYQTRTGDEIDFTLSPFISLAPYDYYYSSFAKEKVSLQTNGQPAEISLKLQVPIDRVETNWHWVSTAAPETGSGASSGHSELALKFEDSTGQEFLVNNQSSGFVSPAETNTITLYSGNQTLVLRSQRNKVEIEPQLPCTSEILLPGELFPTASVALGSPAAQKTELALKVS